MDPTLESMTLANLADGKLEAHFQESLLDVAAVFEEFEHYESNKDGVLTAKIVCEVELSREYDSSLVIVSVRSYAKRPKPKRVASSAFYAASTFTSPKFHQADLLEPQQRPTPLRRPATDEE